MKKQFLVLFLILNNLLPITVFANNEKNFINESNKDYIMQEFEPINKYKKIETFLSFTKKNNEIKQEQLRQQLEQEELEQQKKLEEQNQEEQRLAELKNVNTQNVDEIVYATTSVNIRELPDKNTNKVGTLSYGTSIKRIGILENGWSKVIYDNKECYINSSYLTIEEPKIESNEINNVSNETSNEEVVNNGIIQKEGNVKNSFISLGESYFNKLPTNVQNFLKNNDVKFYITDSNLANRFYSGVYSSVMGVTVYGEKTIYMENRNNAIKLSLIHESGHMIDYLTGTPSSSQEFNEIYQEEKDSFIEIGKQDNNSTSSTIEYFAEVFNQAILYPDSCSSSAPRSYAFVMNIINNLN